MQTHKQQCNIDTIHSNSRVSITAHNQSIIINQTPPPTPIPEQTVILWPTAIAPPTPHDKLRVPSVMLNIIIIISIALAISNRLATQARRTLQRPLKQSTLQPYVNRQMELHTILIAGAYIPLLSMVNLPVSWHSLNPTRAQTRRTRCIVTLRKRKNVQRQPPCPNHAAQPDPGAIEHPTSRGGGQAPGHPAQHNFWSNEQPQQAVSAYKSRILKIINILQITKLYNPPGDGLCFWSALTNGLTPGVQTHAARLLNAVRAVHKVIDYIKNLTPTQQARYREVFAHSVDPSTPVNDQEWESQLSKIQQQPQRYDLPINDVLRLAAADALNCQIEWWSVYRPLAENVQAHCETYGSGPLVRLLYDAQGAHYMHIVDTSKNSSCSQVSVQYGTEQYVSIGREQEHDEDMRIEQAVASWNVSQQAKVKWLEDPWETCTEKTLTVTRSIDIGQDAKGWQTYTLQSYTLTDQEIRDSLNRRLPQYHEVAEMNQPSPPNVLPSPPIPTQVNKSSPPQPSCHPKQGPPAFAVTYTQKSPRQERASLNRTQPEKQAKQTHTKKRPSDLGSEQLRKVLTEKRIDPHLDEDIQRQLHDLYSTDHHLLLTSEVGGGESKEQPTLSQKRRIRRQKLSNARKHKHPPTQASVVGQSWEKGEDETCETVRKPLEGIAHADIPDITSTLNRTPQNSMIVIALNMRSSQNMFKIHHLLHCLTSLPRSADIVITLQETWLQSHSARQQVRQLTLGEGWTAAALDRSRPGEPKSGGIMTLVRPGEQGQHNRMHIKHEIIDDLGVQLTTLYRTNTLETTQTRTCTTAIVNAYVPTGSNRQTREREEQLTNRFLGAIRHASERNMRVLASGDWNHMTDEWEAALSAYGFQTTARVGVVIEMVKDRDAASAGGYTHATQSPQHPLFSDHPLLYTHLQGNPLEEELLYSVSPNRDLLTKHEAEYKQLLLQELQERPPPQLATPTEIMRWAAEQMKQVSQRLTLKYRREPGRQYMHYPRRIQKLHDKLRGTIPLRDGETAAQIKKRVMRAMDIWMRKKMDRIQAQRDRDYDTQMRQTYRRLLNPTSETTHVLEEEQRNGYYTQAAERDECARRVIGAHWQGSRLTLTNLKENTEWMNHVRADPRDTLESVGQELTEAEILDAYKHMRGGKATQNDAVSKELMELIPQEYKQMFVNYIKHAFQTGITELEEGRADIVLLTKKKDKNHREITNKRPIALVKFVTKWLQAILAHRIQKKIKHLANYGFQPERSTASAMRKITALTEYADLHNIPIHLLTVDIEKAYDTVPYALIELMLHTYNCPAHITNLIMSMHTNRALHFKLNGKIGEALTPERGVAQGSPLSCILFVMCMQPLLLRLQAQTTGIWGQEDDAAYVDDLTLVAGTAGQIETKWAIVRAFEQWTQMRININKCEYDTTEPNPLKWACIPGVKKNVRGRQPRRSSAHPRFLDESEWRPKRPA